MRNELLRAAFPGLGERKRAACRTRNRQSLEASRFEILVERTDRIAANHVLRSRNGICGDRNAAGQRFELNDAERVGSARKHKYVGRRKMLTLMDVNEMVDAALVGFDRREAVTLRCAFATST